MLLGVQRSGQSTMATVIGAVLLSSINHSLSLALTALIALHFAAVYKGVPRARTGRADVALVSALTAAMFIMGKVLIGWSIGSNGVAASLGAAMATISATNRISARWLRRKRQAYRLHQRSHLPPAAASNQTDGSEAHDHHGPG